MASSTSDAKESEGGRVGGARAEFIASLGRKVNDTRELLAIVEDDPSSKTGREELRRRIHALGSGARLLRFDAMAHSLQEALAVLDHGAQAGTLREEDVGFVAQVLDDLPALAWGELPAREPMTGTVAEPADEAANCMPVAALIVGGEALAIALADGAPVGARVFECERTEDIDAAFELARSHAPDLLLVDTDLARASELVEAMFDDPLTGPMSVVVIGTFRAPEEVARFAALGVARTLTRPVAPDVIRAACDEVVETRDERTVRVTLGEPTLEQLADRLCEELKRALVESVDRPARAYRVPLGEGTEVLGALWGAIARVQEIIVQKTDGAIRFGGETPEGAIALAPSLHQDLPGADRFAGRGRGAAAEVRLNGRCVVVADDDPGVTWFVADLLRTAGCVVHEALDGTSALDLAFRLQPELIVSDILMPGLDGFALCRALRRDIALRDTPVILLSWKEDLLQRVRELGASAAAYMRKESGPRAILARVREVLRPRARIELRLRGEGEVRGRLDGLTPRLLLELVCLIRKDARVSVRDATYLYEIEIRGGAPRKATRTASDGSYLSGGRALASLLGVGAGRFALMPSSAPIHGELTGSLFDQMERPVAVARGALAVTAGARMASVERIVFDEQSLEEYLRATPEPTRTLIKRLANGTSPRRLLLGGEVAPSLLEDVLSDLAARGAIHAVQGPNGADLLTPAIEAALAVARGAISPRTSMPPNARQGESSPPDTGPPKAASDPFDTAPDVARQRAHEANAVRDPAFPSPDEEDEAPSSLEDAVMREISDRSPEPRASRVPPSDPPPLVELSALRPRLASDPMDLLRPQTLDEAPLASIPPDAVVPGASGGEDVTTISPTPLQPESRPPSPPPSPVDETPLDETNARLAITSPPTHVAASTFDETIGEYAGGSAPSYDAPRVQPPRRRWWLWPATALICVAAFALFRWFREQQETARAVSDAPLVAQSARPPTTGETAILTPSTPSAAPSASSAADDLPLGAEVPPGFGLLEISAPPRAVVRIDGTLAGAGPFVASVTTPGYHEVRIKLGAHESTHVVEVRSAKATHVTSAPVP